MNGGQNAEWKCDTEREQLGDGRELGRGGNALHDQLHGWQVIAERLAEVAMQHAAEPVQVLLVDREIEAHLVAKLGGLLGGCPVWQHAGGDVATGQMQNEEDYGGDAEDNKDGLEESRNDEVEHRPTRRMVHSPQNAVKT